MASDTKNSKTYWVTGGFNLWLLDFSPDRPIKVDLNLQHGENLNLAINGNEWAQIFYGVLNCPTWQDVCKTKDEYSSIDYESMFKSAISEFPMLQELSDTYSKILFSFEHIEKFREELLSVIPKATENEIAMRGLEKLKEACDIALSKKMLLYLV